MVGEGRDAQTPFPHEQHGQFPGRILASRRCCSDSRVEDEAWRAQMVRGGIGRASDNGGTRGRRKGGPGAPEATKARSLLKAVSPPDGARGISLDSTQIAGLR